MFCIFANSHFPSTEPRRNFTGTVRRISHVSPTFPQVLRCTCLAIHIDDFRKIFTLQFRSSRQTFVCNTYLVATLHSTHVQFVLNFKILVCFLTFAFRLHVQKRKSPCGTLQAMVSTCSHKWECACPAPRGALV